MKAAPTSAAGALVDIARSKSFHLSFSRTQGILEPNLIIDSNVRWASLLGRATVALGMPFWLLLAHAHRARLKRTSRRYRGSSSLLWNTVGPGAFWGVSIERLTRQQSPLVGSHTDLLLPGETKRRYLGEESHLIVVDDFYDNPEAVRYAALRASMLPFDKGWFNTVHSRSAPTEFTEEARVKLGKLVGIELPPKTFYSDCGGRSLGWNCAYHAKLAENWLATNACDIHNHANLGAESWSGLVFLDHREERESGLSFWIRQETKSCAEKTWLYDARPNRFRLLTIVPSKFNRLVLFSAPLLHRGERGYGYSAATARLFQTYFFTAEPESAGLRKHKESHG